jgi:hypothetical protein
MQCSHCGREVRETSHRQKSYRVDYYRLHTGQTVWDFFLNPKQDAAPIRYLKLTQPIDIFTCIACYARPEIRQRLDDDFAGRRPLLESHPGGDYKTGPIAKN